MNNPILPQPQTDYRNFRLKQINQPEYKHLWLLMFWPVYGLRYLIIENLIPVEQYNLIHCPLDDMIPFQEIFLIPYGLWFVCLVGMHLYTLLYDIDEFKRYSKFLILSMSLSTLVFILYPSCQDLRPAQLPRDNLLCRIVELLYRMDTNTNVFPSEHAIGAVAVLIASVHTPRLRSPLKTTLITVLMVLICLSTVFLKQHSVLDVLAALPVCAISYWVCYGRKKKDEQAA